MAAYEAVIGLEVHAQLMTKSKAFCFAPNAFGQEENSQVGPVSAGLPGALPVLNKKAVELAVRAGLALNCKVNEKSVFARKNYFYPDLPKGYQISQFDEPIIGFGKVEIHVDGKTKTIEIERIHIEEDAGKSIHLANSTLVNLNRAGVPLIEIVSRPDLRSPQEASEYLRTLHSVLMFAEICDGNMEEGNFRCDVNVSIRPYGQKEYGTRTELKNINSFRFVEKAIEYEVARHISVVESGGSIVQETRGWDAALGKTFSMRTKEEAHDYRYFPDPDLPPLFLPEGYVAKIRSTMPELPSAMRERYQKSLGLTEYSAFMITASKDLSSFFEKTVSLGAAAMPASNWILSELLKLLKDQQLEISQSPITPEALCGLLKLIEDGTISGKIAKDVFQEMFESKSTADEIVKAKGLLQISDTAQIEAWCDEVIAANPGQVAEYRGGKEKVFGFFVGQVMKLCQGKGNPGIIYEIMKRKLS